MISIKILLFLLLPVSIYGYEECYFHCICEKRAIDCRWSNITFIANVSFPPTSTVLKFHKPNMAVLKNDSFLRLPLLRRIDMRKGGIKAIISIESHAFNGLNDLRELQLSGNGLIALPDGFGATLPGLEKLLLSNNRLQKLPVLNGLSNLRELQLSGNALTSLPDGFGSALPKLEKLVLSNNQLQMLQSSWFCGIDNLITLDLSNNHIKYLTRDAFKCLTNLKLLILNKNVISHIEWNAFSALKNVQVIEMDDNSISQLSSASFTSLQLLRRISIRNNNITTLHDATFNDNPSLVDIRIGGNPFKCDCAMRGFRQFMHNSSDILSWAQQFPEAQCATPMRLADRTLLSIPSDGFVCPTTTTTTTTTTTSPPTTKPAILDRSVQPTSSPGDELVGLIIAIALGGMLVLLLMVFALCHIVKQRYRKQKHDKISAQVDAVRDVLGGLNDKGPHSRQLSHRHSMGSYPSNIVQTDPMSPGRLLSVSQNGFLPDGLHVEVKNHSPSTSETHSTQLGSGGSPQINGHVDIVPAFQQNGSSGKKVKLETLV